MSLVRLSLTDFRSYPDLLIEPGPGLVILTGENGAGKTNILEAVSLLAPGRGLRGAALTDMAHSDGPGGFAVAANLTSAFEQGMGGSPVALGTGTLANAPERRLVRINTASAAANALAEWLSVLWLTPAMDRLFTEAPGGRRRFLDRLTLALHAAHAGHAMRYDAAMRARNKLLAEEGQPDPAWLDALEARMAEHGAAVADARAATVAALAERLADAPEGPFARAGIAIGAVETDDLATVLRAGRARDAAAGRTLAGPHRADLEVVHLGTGQPASRASTGEQKALLLGIMLAHADLVQARARRPLILLLDEVAAHLDPVRRGALFARLASFGGQVWMTGTEPALFEGAPAASHYQIANGQAETR